MEPKLVRTHHLVRLAAAGVFSFASLGASAATDTGILTVTASIAAQCAVGTATLGIGAISLVNTTDGTIGGAPGGGGTASVPYACTNGTSATLGFGLGDHSTGTNRRMKSTTAGTSNQYVEYVLRQSSSAGTVIDAAAVTLVAGTGLNQTFSVWGGPADTAANRTASVASDYTDTVVMTITFTP